MAQAEERRRRFAPIPIETTFEQRRKTGPTAEPTPSPSPTSPTPPRREKRHFAPQLVEASIRRSRRAGDIGPATKPSDKTDITPYTKHIYALKSRKRHGQSKPDETRPSAGRRESCDDEIADGVFDLVAKDAQRKLQEIALSAFPNSGVRIGGAEHFFVREGSGSDEDDGPRGRSLTRPTGQRKPSRRDSSDENVGWAVKEMQEHAEQLAKIRGDTRIDSVDLDQLEIESPPADPLWTTQTRASLSGSMSSSVGQIGERHMPLVGEERLEPIGETPMPYVPADSPPFRPIGETFMPYIPAAPSGKAGDMPYVPASQIPAESGFGSNGIFSGGFGVYNPDMEMERGGSLYRLRNQHRRKKDDNYPPLLGKDLEFRRCLSPKHTKLEPDHAWDLATGTTAGNSNRDESQANGLWHGYCWTNDGEQALAPVDRPVMIATPSGQPSSPDPFAAAFGDTLPVTLSEEPTPIATRRGTLSANSSEQRTRPPKSKGVHMLVGLDERLRREKAAAEREDKIRAEFDDAFVTQVYNYLSLGYPAMARVYDEELSKISNITVDALEQDDEVIMDMLGGGKARGYILTMKEKNAMKTATGEGQGNGHREDDLDSAAANGTADGYSNGASDKSEGDMGPRWEALKRYVWEWARQHPDLDSVSPPMWGVRERRGSWGI